MLQPRSKVSGFHASAFPPGTVLFVPQQAEKRTLSGELPFGKDLPMGKIRFFLPLLVRMTDRLPFTVYALDPSVILSAAKDLVQVP
jgi:hypothetical protein